MVIYQAKAQNSTADSGREKQTLVFTKRFASVKLSKYRSESKRVVNSFFLKKHLDNYG